MEASDKQVNVSPDHGLLIPYPPLGKPRGYPSTQSVVLCMPGVDHAYGPLVSLSIIFVGLLKLILVTGIIDVLPRTALNEAQIVGSDPDNWSIFLEQGVRIIRQFSFDTR